MARNNFSDAFFNASDDETNSSIESQTPVATSSTVLVLERYFRTALNSVLLVILLVFAIRLSYRRLFSISTDIHKPNVCLLWILSVIPIVGTVAHLIDFRNDVSSSTFIKINATTFRLDNSPKFFSDALKTTTNRLVAPIVTIFLLHQFVVLNQRIPQVIGSRFLQFGASLIVVLIVSLVTFQNAHQREMEFDLLAEFEPEIMPSFFDIVPPLLNTILFFVAQNSLHQNMVYSEHRKKSTAPTQLDLISKVIVWQLIMLIVTFAAYFLRYYSIYLIFIGHLCLSNQSPCVHLALIRSLLRRKHSKRFCFFLWPECQ